jgi:hypothetical protein
MPEDLDFGVGEDLNSATATVGEYPIARDGGLGSDGDPYNVVTVEMM